MLHVDIMDGHFAKNITLSPGFIRNIRKHTKLPIEAHLMVTSPGDYIDELADCGADYITVHAETVQTEAFRVLGRIKAAVVTTGSEVYSGRIRDEFTPVVIGKLKEYEDEAAALSRTT